MGTGGAWSFASIEPEIKVECSSARMGNTLGERQPSSNTLCKS